MDDAAEDRRIAFADLPAEHPVRDFCEKWGIEDPEAREALCNLMVDAILATVTQLVEGDGDDDGEGERP